MRLWRILSTPFRRAARQPLAARRPSRGEMGQTGAVPLGFEATDLSLVNAVSRRNDALERSNLVRQEDGHAGIAQASTHVEAMPEDETYAARYHRAFQKKDRRNE